MPVVICPFLDTIRITLNLLQLKKEKDPTKLNECPVQHIRRSRTHLAIAQLANVVFFHCYLFCRALRLFPPPFTELSFADSITAMAEKTFTYAEVATHNTKKDLHVVIHDKVYDITSFVDEHPYAPFSFCVTIAIPLRWLETT